MNWEGTRCLVTGGSGFIGSWLVDELLVRGAKVRVVDDLSRNPTPVNLRHCIDKIEFVKADLADMPTAMKATEDIDVCFHLAAIIGGVEYIVTHPAILCKNTVINYNVIESCRINNVEKLLYTSTACVYPIFLQEKETQPPLKEEDALKHGACPDSNYGWAKLIGEIQCRAYCQDYGMKIAVVRPFNAYGGREDFEPERSHVIPALIRKAVRRENPFIVWGDGTQRRAFTYVTDVVEAIILAVEKAVDADPINVGTPEVITIRELAELILKLTDYDVKPFFDLSKPVGVYARKADISKAKRLLNWEPKTGLAEGVQKTIEWYLEHQKEAG